MSERRSPDLSTSEGSNYRRGAGRGNRGNRGKREAAGRPSAARSVGVSFVMAILVAGLALAGWFIANQQQQLATEQDKLEDANSRLVKLEERLSATDSVLSQEGQDTKQQLGLWESEIRKLWAVSNERNKKWIQDNQAAVKKLNGIITGIEASNRDLKAAIGRHEKAVGQQQALIDQLASLELQIGQIVRGQRDLVDKVNTANQGVASLRSSLADKVGDNTEAIAAIDAYRVAVNSRLAEIERRIGALGGPAGP